MVARGLVARYFPANTQSTEGFDNMVTNAVVLTSELQVTVSERSMRQSLLLSWNLGRQRLQLLSGEILKDKEDLEAALQRAVDNHAGHNEELAEFDRFAAPLPSAPAQKARPGVR